MKRKILIGLSIFVILLVFTNPTPTDFKTYLVGKYNLRILPYEQLGNENGIVSYGRTSNFLLFSVYTFNYTIAKYHTPSPTIKRDTNFSAQSFFDHVIDNKNKLKIIGVKIDTIHYDPVEVTTDTSKKYIGIFKNFF